MAHETVTKSQRFYCVSLLPDICKTPVGSSVVPIPYNITGEFRDAQAVSPNVKAHGEPLFLHNRSYIPSVKGDERGVLGGIKSGTFLKRVESLQASTTKGSNGTMTIQEGRLVWMNDRNTIGRVLERKPKAQRPRLKIFGIEVPEELQDAARTYKEEYSKPMHEFGDEAMDAGGKILMGSAALGGAGAAVGATGVGLPVAAAMEAGAAAGGTVGGVVTGAGFATDATATALDKASDFILSGNTPDVWGAVKEIGGSAVENLVLGRLRAGKGLLKQLFKKGATPGKTPKPAPASKSQGAKGKDGVDGGKTKKEKKPKNDKPASCCVKNQGPAKKGATSKKPIHFGTGEEIMFQADFVLDGPIPVTWSRTYRSGSATEDWSMLGCRWASPFNMGVSVCTRGIVFHDDTGRGVRLPRLAVGEEYDHRGEGFVLRRDSDTQFTVIWHNGNVEVLTRGPESILPQGYNGINAMLRPELPSISERYYMTRSHDQNGRGLTVTRFFDAAPGQVLMRIQTDDGKVIEAMRAWLEPGEEAPGHRSYPRIGYVEQVCADGSRNRKATYRYAPMQTSYGEDAQTGGTGPHPDQSPHAWVLECHVDSAQYQRSYRYDHKLLIGMTTFSGFEYRIEWLSMEAILARWSGSTLPTDELRVRYPIKEDNSYRARAVRVTTQDGLNEVAVDYIDPDTSLVTEPNGGVLEYRFDHNWLVVEVLRRTSDGTVASLGKRKWDADGKLIADIDAMGNATQFCYNERGNRTKVIEPLGYTTTMEYDLSGRLIAEIDPLGHRSTFAYDNCGNLIRETDPLGHTTAYNYDDTGRLISITDARGGVKRLSYDDRGLLSSYTDCSQSSTRYIYDGAGRLASIMDPDGGRTVFRYGTRGELTELEFADGSVERFVYDAEDRLVEYIDPAGSSTRYVYNGHHAPVLRIDALGREVRYVYDKALQVTELINENGESHYLAYDVEGRLVSETGIDGKQTTYEYDRAGRLIARDMNGTRATYLRDALGQVEAKQDLDGSIRFAYDPLGRVVAMQSRFAEHRYLYDPAGRLIEERLAYATEGASPQPTEVYDVAFTLRHGFDELGNRLHTVLPNGRRVDTQRYGSRHWHGMLWQGATVVDIERDPMHRETQRRFGSAGSVIATAKEYDPQTRLTRLTLQRDGADVIERRFIYDSRGYLEQVNDSTRGVTRYAYDRIGQLIKAAHPDRTELFSFDPAGNILGSVVAPADPRMGADHGTLMEQPQSSQRPHIAKITQNLLRTFVGARYEYDTRGNTVLKAALLPASANDEPSLTMDYDQENRLHKIVSTWADCNKSSTYCYDGFGRRIAKRVTTTPHSGRPANGAQAHVETTYYVWDGNALCQEISATGTVSYLYEPESFVPVAMVNSCETIQDYASGDVHRCDISEWRRARGPHDHDVHVTAYWCEVSTELEQRHQEKALERRQRAMSNCTSDKIFRYVNDHIGTPVDLVDDDGRIAWSARYSAWGKIWQIGKTNIRQPLRFQGQYEDEETGLYYNRYRYYDAHAGRYLTQDPIGLAGGRNLYRYVTAPTEFIDPLGLFSTANYVYGIGGRIESATATVTPLDLNTGSDTNTTSRRWARRLGCPDDDAGHVIGNQLGGRGGKKYVFPQNFSKNRGEFAQWESRIARDIDRSKLTATLNVELIYNGNSTRPDRIVYSYTINGRTQTREFENPRNCP